MRDKIALIIGVVCLGAPALAVPPPGFTPIDGGHVDFSFCFENGRWKTGVVWDADGNPVGVDPAAGSLLAPELAVLIAKDERYQPGNRVRRPDASTWEFLGVLADLRIGLQLAIKEENYELAAILRDYHHHLRTRLDNQPA